MSDKKIILFHSESCTSDLSLHHTISIMVFPHVTEKNKEYACQSLRRQAFQNTGRHSSSMAGSQQMRRSRYGQTPYRPMVSKPGSRMAELSKDLESMNLSFNLQGHSQDSTRRDHQGLQTHAQSCPPRGARPKTTTQTMMHSMPKAKTIDSCFDQDENGDNQLILATIFNRTEEAIQIITLAKEKGKSELLDIQNRLYRQTALHVAAITRNGEIFKELVSSGAQLDLQDRKGRTPVHILVQNNDIDTFNYVAKFLSKNAFDHLLNITDFDGKACLHVAASVGGVVMIEEMLKHTGVDINMKDTRNHETMLHIAVEKEDLCLLMFLLQRSKIDVDAKRMNGNTALRIAKGKGGTNSRIICTQLMAAGADYRYGDDCDDDEDDDNDMDKHEEGDI
jgi:ankyrin repeat protein